MEEELQVRIPREVRLRVARERHDPNSESFQHRDESQDFFGLSAIAQQKRQVALFDEPQITVQRLGGIQKARRNARAVEGCGNLLRDGRVLTDATEDQFATR